MQYVYPRSGGIPFSDRGAASLRRGNRRGGDLNEPVVGMTFDEGLTRGAGRRAGQTGHQGQEAGAPDRRHAASHRVASIMTINSDRSVVRLPRRACCPGANREKGINEPAAYASNLMYQGQVARRARGAEAEGYKQQRSRRNCHRRDEHDFSRCRRR